MERSWAVLMLTLFALPTQAAVEMYYIHNDHLGTPRVITNQAQQVVWRGQLKPFGETMVEDKKQTSDCHCKWMDISQITLNVMAKSFK